MPRTPFSHPPFADSEARTALDAAAQISSQANFHPQTIAEQIDKFTGRGFFLAALFGFLLGCALVALAWVFPK